ncbi:MAG: phosphoadenylyl-sulfate reductase [Rhodospirillaceae bacterium]
MIGETSPLTRDPASVLQRAAAVAARVDGLEGAALLDRVINTEFPGRIALVSSFGTESAVLLALAAEVAPSVPVLFVDTGRLFGETRRYRDQMAARLGLSEVRTITPDAAAVAALDRDMMLFQSDPDACCHLRKVDPFERALAAFDAWISGRKRFHGATRLELPVVEADRGWIKINPLAEWSRERIQEEFDRRALPSHPLEAEGFLSIGCMPCSARVAPGADIRSGRWAGKDKTECGIHRPANADPANSVSSAMTSAA